MIQLVDEEHQPERVERQSAAPTKAEADLHPVAVDCPTKGVRYIMQAVKHCEALSVVVWGGAGRRRCEMNAARFDQKIADYDEWRAAVEACAFANGHFLEDEIALPDYHRLGYTPRQAYKEDEIERLDREALEASE